MKTFTVIFISASLYAQAPPARPVQPPTTVAAKPSPAAVKASAKAKKPDISATITSGSDMTRSITYNERDIPMISTRLHYTTVIMLPKDEKVMDVLCGNGDNWTINGADGTNLVYVKPEKADTETNLNAITASGNVYAFLLRESSNSEPELKVFVRTEDSGMLKTLAASPKWVPAADLDAAKRETQTAARELSDVKQASEEKISEAEERADTEIARFKSSFPETLKHDYVLKKGKHFQQFDIGGIAHTDTHTYIWADPAETPTLYELKDGKPSLINFEYANGVYTVPKVLDNGYLQIGKRKIEFKREGA